MTWFWWLIIIFDADLCLVLNWINFIFSIFNDIRLAWNHIVKSTAVEQVVACTLVTQRARVRSPVGTSFLSEVFSGFFLACNQGPRISFGHHYHPYSFITGTNDLRCWRALKPKIYIHHIVSSKKGSFAMLYNCSGDFPVNNTSIICKEQYLWIIAQIIR